MSLRRPNVKRSDDTVSKYIMGTHSIVVRGTLRSFMMAGSAIFTILPSRVHMNTPIATNEKTNHLFSSVVLFISNSVNTHLEYAKKAKTWVSLGTYHF